MQSFLISEPLEHQEAWTEYIDALKEMVHSLDCSGEQGSTEDELQFTKKQLQEFGVLLRDRRDAAGFSRLKLARLAKLSDSTVKFTETARHPPSRKTLVRLLAVPELGLTWENLPLQAGTVPQSVPRPSPDTETPATDLNCYLTPSSEPVRMVMDLGRFLNGAGGHVEQTNAYLDHQSAAGYLAMCQQSPAAAAIRASIPLGEIAACILKETSPAGLNVIGLGAGDANLEVRLVQHLAEQQEPSDIRLCLFDVSQPLLSAGFKYATDTLSENPGVTVWAIQGNFHHLPLYTQLHYSPKNAKRRRIFCMFGNTLANLDNEPRFFQYSLVDCLPGDLLILDVQQAQGSVDNPQEILSRDPAFQNPISKAHTEWLAGPLHRHCKDVVEVEFGRYQLDTQCALPGSYALDAIATVKSAGRPDRRFSMFRFKRYDVAKLSQSLAQLGWERLAALPCGGVADKGIVLLFCKRTASPPGVQSA
jgi:transcriptional regulator with XRE-family HTH domain